MEQQSGKRGVLWITRTAIFLALLVVVQISTAPLGNTIITGSAVNAILIICVMICGLSSGLTIAMLSPVLAKLAGIGPLWMLIPFIILGNMVLVLIWHILGNKPFGKKEIVAYVAAAIVAALAKFGVLYIGIVKIAVPFMLDLKEMQAMVISTMFSVPQLITALIGGLVAITIVPAMKKAIKIND